MCSTCTGYIRLNTGCDVRDDEKCTNRFDNNIELHQNWVDYDRKNTHCAVDQNTLIVWTDLQAEYPEIDLMYVIAFQTLSHLPESKNKSSKMNSTVGIHTKKKQTL